MAKVLPVVALAIVGLWVLLLCVVNVVVERTWPWGDQ